MYRKIKLILILLFALGSNGEESENSTNSSATTTATPTAATNFTTVPTTTTTTTTTVAPAVILEQSVPENVTSSSALFNGTVPDRILEELTDNNATATTGNETSTVVTTTTPLPVLEAPIIIRDLLKPNDTIATFIIPITVLIEDETENVTLPNVQNSLDTTGKLVVEPKDEGNVTSVPVLIVQVTTAAASDNLTTTTATPKTPLPQQPAPSQGTTTAGKRQAVPVARNVSDNVVVIDNDFDEIDGWEASLEMQKAFPYYMTGFDDENRPIWVSEWGKFDLRKVVLGGEASIAAFDLYARKAVRIITNSHKLRSTPENPVHQAAFIVDLDGMKLDQYAHVPTVSYALKLAREHRDVIQEHSSRVVVVNTNFFAEAVINIARNVFGRLFERVEVFGTNKSKWMPIMRRIFPEDQIPEWYGGTDKAHKAIFVYG